MSNSKRASRRRQRHNHNWKKPTERVPRFEETEEQYPQSNSGVTLGQTVHMPVYKLLNPKAKDENVEVMDGTVVYIHPEYRFYIVRFDFENGNSIYESYMDCRRPAA